MKNCDGLWVEYLIKEFGDFIVVDNVIFGIEYSEVFVLFGFNGVGKFIMIFFICGDI